MIGARIQCDNCKFIGEMPMAAASRSTAVTPDGWAVICPTIRIKGERDLKPKQRKLLKEKVAEKSRPFHICPSCIFGTYEFNVARLLGAPG